MNKNVLLKAVFLDLCTHGEKSDQILVDNIPDGLLQHKMANDKILHYHMEHLEIKNVITKKKILDGLGGFEFEGEGIKHTSTVIVVYLNIQ